MVIILRSCEASLGYAVLGERSLATLPGEDVASSLTGRGLACDDGCGRLDRRDGRGVEDGGQIAHELLLLVARERSESSRDQRADCDM